MNKNMKILSLITFLLLINCHQTTDLIWNNNELSPEDQLNYEKNVYPTTILPYDSVEIMNRLDEINSLNEKYNDKTRYIPPSLTKFGFPGSDTRLPSFYKHSDIIIDEAEMQYITRSTLKTFNKYTGITDISLLRLRKPQIRDSGTTMRIRTENQVYERLEVKNTSIAVRLNANGIYMLSGNWYNYIYIPKSRFSEEQAKESIIGLELIEGSFAGYITTVVEWKMLNMPAKKVIIPVKSDNKIVLHVVWLITVSKYAGSGYSPSFYVYIDVVTNELIMTEALWGI